MFSLLTRIDINSINCTMNQIPSFWLTTALFVCFFFFLLCFFFLFQFGFALFLIVLLVFICFVLLTTGFVRGGKKTRHAVLILYNPWRIKQWRRRQGMLCMQEADKHESRWNTMICKNAGKNAIKTGFDEIRQWGQGSQIYLTPAAMDWLQWRHKEVAR